MLATITAVLVAVLLGIIIRRYFILTSGERKTKLPFIPDYNLITGSKGIIFTGKVMALEAHEWNLKLGDNFGCYFGQNMQVFSRDPDLIQRIFVKESQKHRNRYHINSLSPFFKASLLEARDEDWTSSRKAIGSVLKASKLKEDNVGTEIDLTISRMLASIDKRCKDFKLKGEEAILDTFVINKNLIMQALLKIIYDADELVDFDSDHNPAVKDLVDFINVNYDAVSSICFLIPVLTDIVRPLLGLFNHGKFLALVTARLESIIKINALKVGKADRTEQKTIHSLIKAYKNKELTKEQLIGNSAFMMLAGFATSVDSMCALMWELAKNPHIQDKLRADLMQYGETSKYLEQCLNETFRLYPGAITNRDLTDHVDAKGIRLVKGVCFNISVYSLHRHPKYWGPDAEVWRPERFADSEVKKHHQAQFLPFGLGPRNCVGYHLARLELTKFAAQLILRFRLEPCKSTPTKIEFFSPGTLPFGIPLKGPMNLKFTPVI